MDVFRQLEQPFNPLLRAPVQAGVDQTSFISQPDRFAAFDRVQPNRRPINDFGGVDETPLINLEKIRLLEIPSKAFKKPEEDEKVQAPTIITPLQSIDAQEGHPIVLAAKIDGTPMPNVSDDHSQYNILMTTFFTKLLIPFFSLHG